ncbi:MAG TPA: 1-(5-phosphoribosyl)-5-[(5-phosphoribosylamino)methylideneamino]imidazole-4-carboxamide isomerase [Kofleriaceae bacterium]|jgi:phosphoribosylformimino-5-aminoimidazole carboxamide ribotide isomerase|nr:1-(5-phosphoribosyl)-5-[(5-phosphoribosylamino)methylideneamino]imidazole-4-carboxamide isomerase [Kofleriaceae bacterium]
MRVWPAIDLLEGRAVRLHEGKRDRATIFSDAPWELPARFAADGAQGLHVVDLDGAFAGAPVQHELVRRLIDAAGDLPVQVGGGIRDRAAVDAVIAAGATRVVLGTAAVKSPALVEEVCRAYPRRVVVAVDAKDGMVAISGWTEASTVTAIELGTRAASWGAAALLYTDVSRDGTGAGPNVEATAALARAVSIEVIASGGVASLDHLRALRDAAIESVVVGRALYDGAFTLREAVEASC